MEDLLSQILTYHRKADKLLEAVYLPENEDDNDTLELPDLQVGDVIYVGKFKNRKATITGFDTDEQGQPVAKTDKGDQKLLKPRIAKIMPGYHNES